MSTTRVIQVIETDLEHRGKGIKGDPCRVVRQYYSLEGELLAEVDPCLHEKPEPPTYGLRKVWLNLDEIERRNIATLGDQSAKLMDTAPRTEPGWAEFHCLIRYTEGA